MTLLGLWFVAAYIVLGYVVLAFAAAANDRPDDETLEDEATSTRQRLWMDEAEDDVATNGRTSRQRRQGLVFGRRP